MKKNTPITLILLLIFSLMLAACQLGAGTGEETPNEGESSEEPGESMPSDATFDPAMGDAADAAGLVYETLDVLALDSSVSDDGLDYIISLRPGVSFHDGTSLNADAVIVNFERWFDAANGVEAWASNFGGYKGETDADGGAKSIFDGIEKEDELTVLVHLNQPDSEFMTKIADPAFSIVSPNALASSSFGTADGVDGGSGPYMIGSWGAELTLEPFPGYWNQEAIPQGSMNISLGN